MKRTAEPDDLMNQKDQALAYAEADFSAANNLFLQLFADQHSAPFNGLALDLGCGPADIPIRFCQQYPSAQVQALDGAKAMLDLAQAAINKNNLQSQIQLQHKYLPATDLTAASFDALLSNSLLHHLKDPQDLWQTIKHCGKPAANVLIMDLLRPATAQQATQLVAEYAADAPDVLSTDFLNSLHAAYTQEELQQQLILAGLEQLQVTQVSDRHLAVHGCL